MLFLRFAVAIAVLSASSLTAEAVCQRPRIHWSNLGDTTNSNWRLAPGDVCEFSNQSNGTAGIYAVEVTVKPKHGVIGHANRYSVAYQASPTYKGPDDFVITLVGKDQRGPGKVTINVNVVVE
jgi:hypothetical protein